MIDKGDQLPVTRQCNLLGLSRSGIYYKPVPSSEQVFFDYLDIISYGWSTPTWNVFALLSLFKPQPP